MKRVVVFVDVQNDFVKGGALAYGFPAGDIVPKIAEFAKECRGRGDHLIFTMDTHGTDYLQSLEGKNLPVPHCIIDTDGWQLAPALRTIAAEKDARVYTKTTFGSSVLAPVVREIWHDERDPGVVDEIVIVGGCTSICVMANAVLLRAACPNTVIKVRADLCFDIDEASHNAALAVLRNQQIDIIAE